MYQNQTKKKEKIRNVIISDESIWRKTKQKWNRKESQCMNEYKNSRVKLSLNYLKLLFFYLYIHKKYK